MLTPKTFTFIFPPNRYDAQEKAAVESARPAKAALKYGAANKPVEEKGNALAQTRLSGKDRVKQQRLSGQSGIGGDFKVWRSEEEMRMRQQFD
jgi:hypothetical protein